MMVLVRFLNPLLMIVVGLGAGVLVAGRQANAWRVYAVGAWTFVLSQVFHIPFNIWVLSGWLEGFSGGPGGLVAVSLALGLSAGVFEEVARYISYRFVIREARSWREGLIFGAGHGGVEAVILGALALYTTLQLVAVQGQDPAALLPGSSLEDLARVQAQVAAFWSLPWYAVLLGALERVFAIVFHLSAALLVLQVFRRGSYLWLLAAVLWHALLDALVVYVSSVAGVYWAEAALAALALVGLVVIFLLRDDERLDRPPSDDGPGEPALVLERVELTPEELEGTRYG